MSLYLKNYASWKLKWKKLFTRMFSSLKQIICEIKKNLIKLDIFLKTVLKENVCTVFIVCLKSIYFINQTKGY